MIKILDQATRSLALGAVIVLLVACTQALPSGSAPASSTPSASPSISSSPSASGSPSSSPSSASVTPSLSASPTATAAEPCPIAEGTGNVPSNRLTDVKATQSAEGDQLTFFFGNNSVPAPGGVAKGELTVAKPPYTEGASGRPITMQGDRVLQLVFRQMSLQSDTGDLVYTGPAELQPPFEILRHAVEFDESEGVIGWYIGFDGPGCVSRARVGRTLVLTFARP